MVACRGSGTGSSAEWSKELATGAARHEEWSRLPGAQPPGHLLKSGQAASK